MPTISTFYGILIRMYFEAGAQHHAPHFHARYQEHQASIRIPGGEVLAGSLPVAQMKLVQAWLVLHADELGAAWQMCLDHEHPPKIAPLQ